MGRAWNGFDSEEGDPGRGIDAAGKREHPPSDGYCDDSASGAIHAIGWL